MSRRLTIAAVALVSVALVLAALGGLALARRAADRDAREALVRQVEGLATTVGDRANIPAAGPIRTALRDALDLSGFDIVVLADPDPEVVADVRASALDAAAAGEQTTYRDGDELVAVVPTPSGNLAVVGRRVAERGLGPAGPWVVLSSVVVLVGAALAATALARRFTAPLAAVEATAGRIADGDLTARVGTEVTDGAGSEIAALGRSIDAMAGALEAAAGNQRSFLLSVSHDLRTPLTSIRGFGELLAEDDDAENARIGGRIEAEARRLERLVGDLLEMATLDARAPSLHLERLDLVDVAEGVAASLAPVAVGAGLTLDVVAPDPAVVRGDADRLAQVLANLVENAIGFARGRIEVRVAVEGVDGVLVVIDDGPGIPADVLPHVFERLHTSRPRVRAGGPGSGLGLAIAAELTTAMGGRAAAASGPDGGATVTVTFPLA